MQHTYCITILWSEALPGDLVFYAGDSHVGVFVGTDEGGNLFIVRCASSQSNVVLTGLRGFIAIGKPDCYPAEQAKGSVPSLERLDMLYVYGMIKKIVNIPESL